MESKFDVDELIECAKYYCSKFYKEFLSNFNNEIIEVCVKLVIDFENDN